MSETAIDFGSEAPHRWSLTFQGTVGEAYAVYLKNALLTILVVLPKIWTSE